MAANDTLNVDAGATFTRQYVYTNTDGSVFDLTGYTARAQVRTDYTAATATIDVNPSIDTATGTISLTFSASQTALLTNTQYVWAMELTKSPTVIRLVEGQVIVSLEVVK